MIVKYDLWHDVILRNLLQGVDSPWLLCHAQNWCFHCLFLFLRVFCYVIWVCWLPPVCLEIHVEFYWQCGSVCKTTLSCLPLLMNAVGYILLPHLYTCIFFIWLMLKLNKEGHVCFLKSDTVFRLSARGGIHYLFTTMCNMMRDNNQY